MYVYKAQKYTPTLQMDSARALAVLFCDGEVTWHPTNSTSPCSIHLNLADRYTTRIIDDYERHEAHPLDRPQIPS